ncbi:MAG: alpha/beta hydrolase [Bacteroidales bacterium]|nr:alpha/beta hydrolase [Bacteroidales bacterium]
MKNELKVIVILLFIISFAVSAQEKHALYTGDIPNSKANSVQETFASGMYRGVTVPELEAYIPDKDIATGAAVVICPGGGYSVVVYQGEGITTAKAFAEKGIAAFVLKYRLPDDNTMPDKKLGPLQDAQQAIKLVRENAAKWGVNPNKIGIIGFSAGGHLASTAATHFSKSLIENNSNTSLRPDFQILVYPVISMQNNLTHADSRKQLLGTNPDQDVIDLFSNELQVDENTPPAYITHAADDKLVDVDNSISYFEELRKHGIPVEMHIYPKGGHGFIFGMKDWMDPLFRWMKRSEIISN